MRRGKCSFCEKPLHTDGIIPVLMDRRGESYHLPCWCRQMDIVIQESRERIAGTKARLAAARRKKHNHLVKPNAEPRPEGSS